MIRLGALGSAGAARARLRRCCRRDIKPSNIIVTHEGRAVLIDFGAARAYAAGQTRGHTVAFTPAYAPLEQYEALGRFDGRTDLYALGATLYHLVSGQPPLPAPDRVQGVALPAPHLIEPRMSEAVSGVIMRALGLRMEERPADFRACALGVALRQAVVVRLGDMVLAMGVGMGSWGWWADGSKQLAAQVLREARGAAERIADASWRAVALRAITEAQAKAGQAQEALRWARKLADPQDRAFALLGVAEGILGIGTEEEQEK